MRYTIRPISDRTPFTGVRKPNPFSSKWFTTLQLLGEELHHLKAKDVVIEVDVTSESDISLDGMLRAKAKVKSGAVRIAFDSIHGPLTYATNRFYGAYSNDPPDWQINVRAIALSLEALRKVDRFGVIRHGEQYTGFKAIGAGRAMPSSHMTSDQADEVLWELSGLGRDNQWPVQARWTKARARSHPDRHDGDRTLWDQVEQAAAVLGLLR